MKSKAVIIAGIFFCLMFANKGFSQVGINLTGAPAHTSALLDVSGNTGGFLAPRMTLNERLNIPTPAEGLIVYQTDFERGYYYFDGFSWILFSEPPYISPWTVFGDTVYRILGPDTILTISEDNVGIGVTSPRFMLDVEEDIRTQWGMRFGYASEFHDNYIWSNQYGLELDNFQARDIRLMTSTTPGTAIIRMVIKADGNIGIGGTLNPGGLLGFKDSNTFMDVDTEGNLLFTDVNTGTRALIDLAHRHWTPYGDTIYRIVGMDTVVTISEDNVGIGVTNPTFMLDVAEEIRAMWGVRYGYVNSTIDNLIWSNQYGLELDNFQTTDIRFMTSESMGTGYLRMSIKPNGNIGINRDDPDKKLCVEGGLRIGSGVDQTSRDNNILYIGDLEYVRIGEWNGDDKMSLRASSFSFENGYVGIGEVYPQRSLHVNDVIRLEPRATVPSDPQMGDMYVRSSDGKLMVYDGSVWRGCW
jgi:hypothetical protein